ncbi:hypothetical protein SAMN04488564_117101 [Lentzea waywayandensis]|uniref:Uncharacterized protein n=1 Tax=Lentzea waywayandensis TaxID=84724 RepID=A0A1I6FHB9_9PSEU|nr:hypothetical protein SAMN04488564_117101 [Lentzea waywayandensis]
MALVDDSASTDLAIYDEAFNPARFKRLRPCPQGCFGGQ